MPSVIELTAYKFAELSDKAKDRVRGYARDWDVEDEWWDSTFDDAVRMGALMGIEISSTTHTSRKLDPKDCRSWEKIDIYFSGFWSQGDGASFSGRYYCVPDAVAKIKAECNDVELIAFAEKLTALQMRVKLEHGSTLQCNIYKSGRYNNSQTMAVADIVWEDDAPNMADADEFAELEVEALQRLLRSFADWIYDQLEAEYEHLTSDEHVDERLSEGSYRFDVDGDII